MQFIFNNIQRITNDNIHKKGITVEFVNTFNSNYYYLNFYTYIIKHRS